MYIHQKDWQAAIRVAKSHDHLLVSKVLSAQAEDVAASGGRKLLPAIEKPHVDTGQYQAAQTETGQVCIISITATTTMLFSDFSFRMDQKRTISIWQGHKNLPEIGLGQ